MSLESDIPRILLLPTGQFVLGRDVHADPALFERMPPVMSRGEMNLVTELMAREYGFLWHQSHGGRRIDAALASRTGNDKSTIELWLLSTWPSHLPSSGLEWEAFHDTWQDIFRRLVQKAPGEKTTYRYLMIRPDILDRAGLLDAAQKDKMNLIAFFGLGKKMPNGLIEEA